MVIIAIIIWKDGEITVSDMSGEGDIPNALQLCKALVRHDGDAPTLCRERSTAYNYK